MRAKLTTTCLRIKKEQATHLYTTNLLWESSACRNNSQRVMQHPKRFRISLCPSLCMPVVAGLVNCQLESYLSWRWPLHRYLYSMSVKFSNDSTRRRNLRLSYIIGVTIFCNLVVGIPPPERNSYTSPSRGTTS